MYNSDTILGMLYTFVGAALLLIFLGPWLKTLLFIALGVWLINRGQIMQGKPGIFVMFMHWFTALQHLRRYR